MTATLPDTATDTRLRLNIDSPGGLPLRVAGFLLQAVGHAYPGTQIDTGKGGFGAPVLSLLIPREDYLQSDGLTEEELAALAPGKDEPGLTAFTNGFRDGSLSVGPPPWMATMLRNTAEQVHDAVVEGSNPANYLQVEILPQDGGESFKWIICRRGGQSPHELREQAEARVAQLEAQLREHGIEPVYEPDEVIEP